MRPASPVRPAAPAPAGPESPGKRLHEMNALGDMGRFPVAVYAGATANVLASTALAYWLHGRTGGHPAAMLVFAVGLVGLNLTPVVLLRRWFPAGADTPVIERMSFLGDQHRFATWVYAVASGNLFFWVVLAWSAFSLERSGRALAGVWALALVATLFPVWRRLLPRAGGRGRSAAGGARDGDRPPAEV